MKPGRHKKKKTATLIRNSSFLDRLHDTKFTGLRSCRVLQLLATKSREGWDFPSSLLHELLRGSKKVPRASQSRQIHGLKNHWLGYFNPIVNNLLWTRIAVIRHYYWIVYICCGSILFLVLILFPFVLKSLSYITIPKDKGK